jgi:small subunit ribosomal protein S15
MALSKEKTAELVKKFQRKEGDTASPEVQVALLTARLEYLNEHFKKNKKDHHSRQGLMSLVGQRRRLLNYLHRTQNDAYKKLIQDLGIRK